MDEDNLLKECLSGNTRAQKLLYDRYAPRMFGVCLRYAPDQNMAEDFMQEGFIRIFSKLGSYKSQGSLEGWMRRVMVNTSLEILRKKDILKNSIELTSFGEGSINHDSVSSEDDDSMLALVPAEVLYKALTEMPTGFRTVFNLFVVEDYSHKDIGQMLDISEGTSKSQYARARAWLRKRLTETKTLTNARKR
ncbi:MAG: RNA polymerase sigma factor [Chloroflexota bacterium]|jgi:RNA polymerase sigma-70 factor (ECF subfamily)|nr:sigma-70 family RNA polymerase sigma factor [Lentimicrobium sp.]